MKMDNICDDPKHYFWFIIEFKTQDTFYRIYIQSNPYVQHIDSDRRILLNFNLQSTCLIRLLLDLLVSFYFQLNFQIQLLLIILLDLHGSIAGLILHFVKVYLKMFTFGNKSCNADTQFINIVSTHLLPARSLLIHTTNTTQKHEKCGNVNINYFIIINFKGSSLYKVLVTLCTCFEVFFLES